MDVLIALGTSMAWGFSAAVTLLGLHEQHVYFEAGATVAALITDHPDKQRNDEASLAR